ncbi:hypothetical protein [Sphingomonas jeddahensis]|uniref:Lipoprotein n=1 Tax=Sphingomonas jeddahensis TaxID=1915074 RepID=A0A1V2EXU4_9SPHN|nr:hypothetical protein [Sphingomonas jeddahensis]ONF96984.1 hypothetical protein SPHI_04160 [Sphingomonas jeddahensis]
MAWIRKNLGKTLAAFVLVWLAGCATWVSLPTKPQLGQLAEGEQSVPIGFEDPAVQANRIASQANAIAYRQGIAASIGAVTGILTLLSAVAAAIYARAAAGESRRSADIAQQALVAGERAWISVHVTPEGPLKLLPHGGLSLEIGVHIKNIGKTPALNVYTDVDEIHLGLVNPPERAGAFAKSKRVVNTTASRLLLPDQQYVRLWIPGAEGATNEFPLFPVLVGCVTYQILPDGTLHQTAFAMMITRKDESELLSYEPGIEIPQEQLEFLHVAGAFAD